MKTDVSFLANCQIGNVLHISSTFTNFCLAYLFIFLFDLNHPPETACTLFKQNKTNQLFFYCSVAKVDILYIQQLAYARKIMK